jgi:hypothetical protein
MAMHLALLLLLSVLQPGRALSQLSLRDGAVHVGAEAWFNPGNTSVTVDGSVYSTADGSLKASGAAETSQGSDTLGAYTMTTNKWTAGTTPFETSHRVYDGGEIVVFSQTFPKGASGTSVTGGGDISSCYPSIDPTPAGGKPLGYVSWQGRFMEASRGGEWQGEGGRGGPGPGTGGAGGPFVVFGQPMTDSIVISAASNFMTNSVGSSPAKGDSSFCLGLDGPVESVPAGYSLETMFHLGVGVNRAVKSFGTSLLKKYGTVRQDDYTRHWLGFSTDNGAYYYYGWHTGHDNGQTYQDALTNVHAYAVAEDIPYKHVLLDSWWYTKGAAAGVKEWDATNSTFPDGLAAFAKKSDWKFQMHNRMWSDDNIYATQNGGKYHFHVEPQAPRGSGQKSGPGESGLSIPDDQQLWDDLMSNKTENEIPLVVYEQDWMYNEWQGLNVTQHSPTMSRDWLMQMGEGAAKSNVSIQYCMTFARMVLQSSEIPAVTTFRASDDYGPGQTGYYPTQKNASLPPTDGSTGCGFPYCVYYVGTTSILAWGMDLGPSKDNYWSKPLQPGSAFNRNSDPWHPSTLNSTHEPYNEMQSAISSFTTAQVAPSDGVGFSNASLIKMACRSDGYLLQPSAPARAIDASFALQGNPEPRIENVHAIMATHTEIGESKWAHVLVIGLNASFELGPEHIEGELTNDTSVEHLVWSGYQPSDTVGKMAGGPNVTVRAEPFSTKAPLEISACGYSDFGLYHIAPVSKVSGFAFLGEGARSLAQAEHNRSTSQHPVSRTFSDHGSHCVYC